MKKSVNNFNDEIIASNDKKSPLNAVKKGNDCFNSILDSINDIIELNNIDLNETNELDCYLNKTFIKEQRQKFDDNPLLFWSNKNTHSEFPKLSKLATFIHAMQASEAPSECLFSLSNNIVNEKRTRLTNEKVSRVSTCE